VAVCVEKSGKISKVDVLRSSGDPKLDEFTTKELPKQRISPFKDGDGKPIKVCNHHMDIEWPKPPPH
jgi:hypothetical protein